MKPELALTFVCALGLSLCRPAGLIARMPDVVLILCDDLGYGDVGSYNSRSRIPTPQIDRLAAEGMRFSDAHTPSAVCTPTRYGLLTGRYCWRTRLKDGVLDGFDRPLIEPGRITLASLARQHGYRTACVGKWHLGADWRRRDGQRMPFRGGLGEFRPGTDVDFTRDLGGGPLDCGFDSWFGISASLDMAPYCFIENRRAIGRPTETAPADKTLFLNQAAGVTTPGFSLEGVLPALTRRAVEIIETDAAKESPFLLYLALSSPHLPVVPGPRWRGKTGAGLYADFVAETDAAVGAVLDALKRTGAAENTLVLFTSDNGGLWHSWTAAETDDKAGYQPTPRGRYNAERGHQSNASLRGTKADIWEGGHRVPFIVCWPARVKAGVVNDSLVELTDALATFAEILGAALPATAGEDSIRFPPGLLTSNEAAAPPPTPASARRFSVHHSLRGVFALREGPWKYVPSRGSGGFSTPRTVTPQAGEPEGQLYHLGNDPAESQNVWKQHPETVARLARRLAAIMASPRSRGLPSD